MKNIRIKALFDTLYLNKKQLSSSQLNFVNSVKRQFEENRDLSEAQCKILTEIKTHTGVAPVRYTMKTDY